jgi:hypothetical protein
MPKLANTIVRKLKKNCPLQTKIRIKYTSLVDQNVCGLCSAYLDKNNNLIRFLLQIERDLDGQALLDTLLHEWAHALDIERNGLGREPHRNSWGIAYAQVWRAYMQSS